MENNSNATLDIPARITIVRDKYMVDALVPVAYECNGEDVGVIKNGKSVTITTQKAENYVGAKKAKGFRQLRNLDGFGPELVKCTAGGHVEVHFKSGQFDRIVEIDS